MSAEEVFEARVRKIVREELLSSKFREQRADEPVGKAAPPVDALQPVLKFDDTGEQDPGKSVRESLKLFLGYIAVLTADRLQDAA